MKLVFVLFRRSDFSHEQSMALWNGEQHTSIVTRIPGLKKWVQNHAIDLPSQAAADGIGELWFDSAAAMEQAMNSTQMTAAEKTRKDFSIWRKPMLLQSTKR